MKRFYPCIAIAIVAILSVVPVRAQTPSDWSFDLTGYMWFPETRTTVTTPRGDAQTTLSASDALKNLDVGVMLSGAARRGKWSLVADFLYLDISASKSTPFGALFSEVEAGTRLMSASGYGLYQVSKGENYRLDVGLGFRAMQSDMTIRFRPGMLPGEKIKITDTWVDPLLALRYRLDFNEKWSAGLALDYGGFGWGSASDETWQAVATVGYSFNKQWAVAGGWRYLHVDRENGEHPYKLKMSGPMLGLTYRF